MKRARFASDVVGSDTQQQQQQPLDSPSPAATGSGGEPAAAGAAKAEQEAALRSEWAAKLAAAEADRLALESGAHPTLLERCAVFECVKVDAVAKATTYREWQLSSVQKLFEYQLYVADTTCEASKRECLERLQEEVAERKRVLAAKLAGVPDAKREQRRCGLVLCAVVAAVCRLYCCRCPALLLLVFLFFKLCVCGGRAAEYGCLLRCVYCSSSFTASANAFAYRWHPNSVVTQHSPTTSPSVWTSASLRKYCICTERSPYFYLGLQRKVSARCASYVVISSQSPVCS